jgi:hypothetical protein
MKTPSAPNKTSMIGLNDANHSAQFHVCDGLTLRMHDDSFLFVRPFAIEREHPDYQCPQDPHRDHGLVLLHPQNAFPESVFGPRCCHFATSFAARD